MTQDEAINAIIEAANKSGPNSMMHYAASYAEAGRGLTCSDWRVQCLYILNNLTGWRGDKAKEVKAFLRAQSSKAKQP
jgi:hypothetical protein